MGTDLVAKYVGLLAQFDLGDDFSKGQHEGLVAFLSDPALDEGKLVAMLNDFRARAQTPNNGYLRGPTDKWVMYVDAFERRGTINPIDDEEFERRWEENRRNVDREYLRETDPALFEEVYGR